MRTIRAFLDPEDIALIRAFEVELPFELGRQGTGYEKCAVADLAALAALIARSLAELGVAPDHPHDAWILRSRFGSHVPPHRDDAPPGKEHHRINAIVTAAGGGEVSVEGTAIALAVGDAYAFRPDTMLHAVSAVTAGTRLVWSVGTLR